MPNYIVYVDFRDAIRSDCNEYNLTASSRCNAIYKALKEFCQDDEMGDSELVSISVIETNVLSH